MYRTWPAAGFSTALIVQLALLFVTGNASAGSLSELDLSQASHTTAKVAADDTDAQAERPRVDWLGFRVDPPRAAGIERAARDAIRLHSGTATAVVTGTGIELRLADHQLLWGGAQLLRFERHHQRIPVFRGDVGVLMDADGRARFRSGIALTANAPDADSFRTLTADAGLHAIAAVLAPYGFSPTQFVAGEREATVGGYDFWRFSASARRATSGAELLRSPRVRPVWFPLPGGLVAAFHVETEVAPRPGASAELYAHVVSATDQRLLFRMNQTVSHVYGYRVFAETEGLKLPWPGPQRRADFPHPSGSPDDSVPPLLGPVQLELAAPPLTSIWPLADALDPWFLRVGSFSRSNHADAYADLYAPDGYSDGDLRAAVSAPLMFTPVFDPGREPDADAEQIQAAVLNMFYVVNYLHSWFHLAGFTEAAGNAQFDNLGRRGLDNDGLRVEALDHSGSNNANMATPADGASPRMQLFRYDAPVDARLRRTGHPDMLAQVAGFGAEAFVLSGPLVPAMDGEAPADDACQPLSPAAAGQIVLVQRGNCLFAEKARNAQAGGAIAIVISNNQGSDPPALEGEGDDITLPVLGVDAAQGQVLRDAVAGGPVEVTLQRQPGPRRDGSLDAAIIAHEWGHYISNRLIGNAAGLSNHAGRSMGEGWADFHALLLLVQEQDRLRPGNASFEGAYGVINHVNAGSFPSFSPNASYFGLRRFPYSTDFGRNALTFRNMAANEELPGTAPKSPVPYSLDNSEVHNSGEVWASLLWECYAGLLRETLPPAPRYSFGEAQRRMSEYLVAAYKLTPPAPTMIEARDALWAAIAVQDLQDLAICADGFARRGAGLRAVSAPRNSLSHIGIEESFVSGGDLAVDSMELLDTAGCDDDGILDAGEAGELRVTVRNTGTVPLFASTLQVTADNDQLQFPGGVSVTVPPSVPQQQHSVAVPVRLLASIGATRTTIGFAAVADDPAVQFDAGVPLQAELAVAFDEVPQNSRIDRFEARELGWTLQIDGELDPDLAGWRRVELAATEAVALGPGPGAAGVSWMISPALQVASDAELEIGFRSRWQFERGSNAYYDGGVVEISNDHGVTWQDAATLGQLQPPYGGELSDCCDNPLSGRPAYVGSSDAYPEQFIAHTLQLGSQFSGQTIHLRFGVAADAAVSRAGWELDDVMVAGLSNWPFPAVVADALACFNNGLFGDGFELRNP